METIVHTEKWLSNGLVVAKIMTCYGVVTMIICILAFRSQNPFFQGTSIPLIILSLMFCAYGGSVMVRHDKTLKGYIAQFREDNSAFRNSEEKRIEETVQTFTITTTVWLVVTVAGGLLCLLLSNNYAKGIGLGVFVFGISAFIVDTLFSTFAREYLGRLAD